MNEDIDFEIFVALQEALAPPPRIREVGEVLARARRRKAVRRAANQVSLFVWDRPAPKRNRWTHIRVGERTQERLVPSFALMIPLVASGFGLALALNGFLL